ncbi:MAG: hypothetical protein RLZ12_283 [Bacillota bacterium]
MCLATRVQDLQPSLTLKLAQLANEAKSAGKKIISFGIGEPDFDTPGHIVQAAIEALQQGKTRYTATSGIPELKEALVRKFATENELTYTPQQVTVTVGAKHALYNIFQVLLNPGDEVVVLAPYWVSYPEQIKLAGGKVAVVQTKEDNNFKVTPQELRAAIAPQTKVFLINSPVNPTGAVYTKSELLTLAKVCLEHNLIIVTDEIYEHFTYDGAEHVSMASLGQEFYERTVVINGLSKAYAMTGWRIGYAAGPVSLIKAMNDLACHSTSCCTAMAQYAAVVALLGSQEPVREMKNAFQSRRNYMFEHLQSLRGVKYNTPLGAFYVYLNIKEILARKGYSTAAEFCEKLLEQEGIVVIPGEIFGTPGYVRLSYAVSHDDLQEGLKKIEKFITN